MPSLNLVFYWGKILKTLIPLSPLFNKSEWLTIFGMARRKRTREIAEFRMFIGWEEHCTPVGYWFTNIKRIDSLKIPHKSYYRQWTSSFGGRNVIKHWCYLKNGVEAGPEDAPTMRALARDGRIMPQDQIRSTLIPPFSWGYARDEPFIYAECLKFGAESYMEKGNLENATKCYKEALLQYSVEGKDMAMHMNLLGGAKEIYDYLKGRMEEQDREELDDIEKPLTQLVNFDNLMRERIFDWSLQCNDLISKLLPEESPHCASFRKQKEFIENLTSVEKPDWSQVSLKVNEQSILLSNIAKETPRGVFQKTLANWLG